MKKIGIITFHNAYNYGAVLQAYALKNIVGSNCEIINYNNPFLWNSEYFVKNKSIKRKIASFVYRLQLKKRINRFQFFREEYLVNTQHTVNDAELKSLNDQYDMFITGSDQVWNMECSGNKTAYFLDYVNDSGKKNSYAASFGSDNVSSYNKQVAKELLVDFKNISVREKSGQKLVRELIGREVPIVLDPSLLLSISDWNELLDKNGCVRISKRKYILLFTVLNGENIIEFAKKLAKKLDMELFYITTSLKPHFGIKSIRDAGPIEWLSLIKNADIVVTNSFHGLAFSLIFNKSFYIELLPPPSKTNARLLELLDDLQLRDRVIDNNNTINESNVTINYNNVNEILGSKRKDSLKFLNNMICE